MEGERAALAAIEATPAQVERAEARAIDKTTTWAASQVARQLAREHRLPLRSIRRSGKRGNRIFRLGVRAGRRGKVNNVRVGLGSARGSVWIGLNPIKAAYIGALRQLRRGARAGRHFFEGSFIATMKSGHTGVWHKQTVRYAYSGRTVERLEPDTVELDRGQAIADRVQAQVPQRLSTLLAQELNYEVNVRGRR